MNMRYKKLIFASLVLLVLLAIAIPLIVLSVSKVPEARGAIVSNRGAIVSNGGPCAEIGMSIMRKYENAVDAMIATMLCDGVASMNNMGIGGGFVATIYKRNERKAHALIARETAPAAATETMFHDNQTLAQTGGLSVAVPGEIMGYWEMYTRFGGSAPWKELFQPTIQLCRNGVPMNKHIATNIASYKDQIFRSKSLSNLLKNDKGELPVENDLVKLPKLADTLEMIAENGPSVLYNGSLSQPLINDIVADGGIMTVEDLASYRVRWEEPVTTNLSQGLTMFSVPAPASGPILSFILSALDGLIPTSSLEVDTAMITEAFKFAYGIRSHFGDPHIVDISEVLNNLKDPLVISNVRRKLNVTKTSTNVSYYGGDYFSEDHGTANMVSLAPNGDAVVATSTINLVFGSKLVSESTGIILNDQMDDFSSPGIVNAFGVTPSPSNFIKPGARPVTSMCPTIFVQENGDVRLAVGGAGGTKITTSTALISINNLWRHLDIKESILSPRFHHQLMPMIWYYETSILKSIVDYMIGLGHTVKDQPSIQSCVTAISKIGEEIMGSDDIRRPGNVSYLISS